MNELLNVDWLATLHREGLLGIQMVSTLSSCTAIVLYLADLYRYEKSIRMGWFFKKGTKTDTKQYIKKKESGGAEESLWGLQSIGHKEILIPKVALKGRTIPMEPTYEEGSSLLVFNTAILEDLVSGYYYWDNDQWVCLATADYIEANANNEADDWPSSLMTIHHVPDEVMNKILDFSHDCGKLGGLRIMVTEPLRTKT